MKRTIERILFMIIGALIAFFAYMVGNTDRNAEAQNQNLGKEISCDVLYAKRIFVAEPSIGGIVMGAFKKGEYGISQDAAGLFLSHTNSIRPSGLQDINSQILMTASKNKAWIEVGYPTKGKIQMSATENELGIAAFNGDEMIISRSQVGMSILKTNRVSIFLNDHKDSKMFLTTD